MDKKRTQEEIQAEVVALKELRPKVPHHNYFGDDNRKAIDVSLSILEGRMDRDALYDMYGARGDEPYQFMLDNGRETFDWLERESEDSPSAGWAGLTTYKAQHPEE